MAVDDSDAPSLQMFGQDGGKRAALRLNPNDVPSLRLYDATGSVRSVTGFSLNDMQARLYPVWRKWRRPSCQ